MSSSVMMGVATLLLLAGVLAAYLGRRHRPTALVLGALTIVFVILACMFLAADRFTGHGIDQAVLYHVAYGLSGAGFSEYSTLIAIVVLLAALGVAAAVGCTMLLSRARRPARVLPTLRAAVPLALLACALNPASKDLFQLSSASAAFTAFTRGDSAEHTSFKAYYRIPKLDSGPKQRRSFIYIYGEGLERTYFDQALFPELITGLRELEGTSTSFTNLSQTNGTSFTIGGIVGSQCGLPLVTSSAGNSMGGVTHFLPNAVCLGDLLSARGYQLSYLGGASLDFAGKGKFLSGHGFSDVRGREQLASTLADPSYQSGWGLHDDSLLDIAYDKVIELSSKQKPFGLFMLTLDTHHPDGHISDSVANVSYEDGRVAILNAVARSDKLLTAFVRRIRETPETRDLLIVLSSDHLAMRNGATARLERGERRNLFMILDPLQQTPVVVDQPGTTLDVGPTFLHALGYHAQLGLGRDLLAGEVSLSAELPDFKSSLASWKGPLSGFWGFSTLEDVSIKPEDNTIQAGGTTILAPALITFDEEYAAEVFFEFNSRQTTLSDYVFKLPRSKPFLWVVDCARAAQYADLTAHARGKELCVVAGRRGAQPVIAQPVATSREISKDQLDLVLASVSDPNLHKEQTRRLSQGQLPNGLDALVAALPEGGTFFYQKKDRSAKYLQEYAARPEIQSKGIVWTTSIPKDASFFFAAPSLKSVRKSRRHKVRRTTHTDNPEKQRSDIYEATLIQ